MLLLYKLTLIYSSCRAPNSFTIATKLNLKVYGGDAKDAFVHSSGPEMDTYLVIYDAYAEWYEQTLAKPIN